MAGPDLLRPPIEQQLGSGVAGQQVLPDVAGQGDGLPPGYAAGDWNLGLIGHGMFVAEGHLVTPRGREHVVINVSNGVVIRKPLGLQATGSSASPRA